MSAGHNQDSNTRGLSAIVINRLIANPEIRRHLYAPYTLDRKHDLPYLAGYSKDGKTRYIDRHLPETLACTEDGHRQEFATAPHLMDHEGFEKAIMDVLGWGYSHAHEAANGYERRGVLKAGLPWQPYNKALLPYIKADEREKLVKVPADLDLAPYYAPPVDKCLLAHMEVAMGRGKQSKEEVDYEPVASMPKTRCGNCGHFSKPNSCMLVRGYISEKAWCILWSSKHGATD